MPTSSLSGRRLAGYDVGPLVGAGGDQSPRAVPRLIVALNWFEELKARMAAR
jgi:hypothetical protein